MDNGILSWKIKKIKLDLLVEIDLLLTQKKLLLFQEKLI